MVGPYTLIRRLGSGGIGIVYLVEREVAGVRQRSALKVLSPHAAGPSFVDRFEKERRILASLDHPYITRMLDAGLDGEQQPYLVMEYVDGQHLDVYCDELKFSVENRLRLFLKICEGVDYAHRNLVVHLDLKPSNILVTADGTPKLLDFGTSKLVAIDGHVTTTLQATPSYASPEQMRNEAVTTACDVYSLGAILYELLAGRQLNGGYSIAAILERVVEEKEPSKLNETVTELAAENRRLTQGRLRSVLAGDLSTIVRKCLSGKPFDRYSSVLALKEDIARYLEGRPVLAQRQTAFYHLSKFVRRNRGKVIVSILTVMALVASLGSAWWGQRQALQEGQRAMRMQTFLYRLLSTSNSNYTGKPASTVREFLMLGIKILPDYIKDRSDLLQAQLALAESIYWNSDYVDSERLFGQIAESARAAHDSGVEAQARAYSADIAYTFGRSDEALSRSATALEVSRRPGVPPAARALCARSYALVRTERGEHTPENLKLLEYAVQEANENGLPAHDIGQYRYYLASELATTGRLAEAEYQYDLATRMNDNDPLSMCDNGVILYGLGQLRRYQARDDEAAITFSKAYRHFLTCYGAADPDTVRSHEQWALALVRAGRAAEAVQTLEETLALSRKTLPAGSAQFYDSLEGLGGAYLQLNRVNDADRLSREALSVIEGKVPANDRRLGFTHFLIARVLVDEGRYREAERNAQAAISILTASPATPEVQKTITATRTLLAAIEKKLLPA